MEYPKSAGYFSKSELVSLSECLGYPGQMLINGMKACSSAQIQAAPNNLEGGQSSVSSKLVAEVLVQRHMNRHLEHLFNNHSAQYNQKVFKKAMYMLQHHKLSFSELYKVRISFELYSERSGGGMKPDSDTVLPALKMAGKLMAPVQLDSLLKRHLTNCDLPPNIQLYEFMDIVTLAVPYCEVVKEEEKLTEMENSEATREEDRPVMLTSYERMLMTEDEQHLTYLDRKYKASMYKEVKPKAPPAQFSRVQLISSAARQSSSAAARRELRALTPVLEVSQRNAHQARNGFFTLSSEQHKEIESRCISREQSREQPEK